MGRREGLTGPIHERGEAEYASLRAAAVWNGVVPERFPDAIARPSGRDEVASLVRAAVDRGRRIAIRSGGHNWLGGFLRDDGLLLDFGDLNRVEVDPERRLAQAEPGATHQALANAIVPHGLGFPIGHCPTVGLGGYLLAGGYGWNPRTWGPACWSVAAVDVVDAAGEEHLIDGDNLSDLLWAACGGGSGFPAVATRYHLRLQPLPSIASVRRDYPLGCLTELLPWSSEVESMPPGNEISLIAHRPPDPATGARAEGRATVQASGFAETPDGAVDLARSAADASPLPGDCLDERTFPEVALNDLEGEGAWVQGLRYSVDMCWTTGGYAETAEACVAAIREAPSELSRIVFAWGFAPANAPDVAQTANGTLTVNVYAIWEREDGDQANRAWVRSLMEAIEPWTTGFYAGESDLAVTPDRPRRCYPPEKWERLNEIRDRYDPERRKYGYLSED